MGKLRTAILDLQKLIVENPAKQEKIEKELESAVHNINQIGGTADEGWNQLYLQVASKFEDQKTTVEANLKTPLKDIADSSMVSTIKGIETFRQSLFKACDKFSEIYDAGIGQIKKDLDTAEEQCAALRAIANKKKSKWLASAKYKDKIKGYLEVIDSVEQIIKDQKKEIASIKNFDRGWALKQFPQAKVTMTVAEIKDRAGMGAVASVKAYLGNLNNVNSQIRGMRGEYKVMAGQMSSIKKWAEDADELESIDEIAPKKIDPSKAAKLLGIKDVDALKEALEAQRDGDTKGALELLAKLAKAEKIKDKAEAMLKALEKAGLA
jgi:DNA-binding transcriptional regulator GbsR (MarR family)